MLAGADVEAASSDDAVAQFEGVSVQAPRGRFEIEMHLQHLSLVGLNQEFKVGVGGCGKGSIAWFRRCFLTVAPSGQYIDLCTEALLPLLLDLLYLQVILFHRARVLPAQDPPSPGKESEERILPGALLTLFVPFPAANSGPLLVHRARLCAAQVQHPAHHGGPVPGPAHPQGPDLLPARPLPVPQRRGGHGESGFLLPFAFLGHACVS